MADRFVGPGGNDGNNGLTWALRKLTLNGVEDTPVVAGDTVYVGPGVYRESLTVDVNGAGGNIITYIADVSGENTDGVGGTVRITGSNNDQATARASCITATSKDYRTFRGFTMDLTSSRIISMTTCENWIIEDCVITVGSAGGGIFSDGDAQDNITIRRCEFFENGKQLACIKFDSATDQDDKTLLIENCFFRGNHYQIWAVDIGGGIIKNCTFVGTGFMGVIVQSLTGGQQWDVNNCIFQGCNTAVFAGVLGEIVEDYNTFFGNGTDRTNVAVGGNSLTYPWLPITPIVLDGFLYPWLFGQLSEWSQVAGVAGTGEATDDFHGIARPTTSSKKSWGAFQLREGQRETGTVRTGVASINLADAGDHQIFVPVDDVEMTISVYVYREANYAGVNPRMIIRQPGEADDVTTDVGGAAGWNLLTTTLTPSADTDYVVVILRSLNTAAAGNYDVFFDDLQVT